MNNFLFFFNFFVLYFVEVEVWICWLWSIIVFFVNVGCEIEILVIYGGMVVEDLYDFVVGVLMFIEDYVYCYSLVIYIVVCVGLMLGFVYMVGLFFEFVVLWCKVLCMSVVVGLVIVGGS